MTQNFAKADLSKSSVYGIPTQSERRSLDLALIAKGICSGVFISGRSIDDILTKTISPETEDGLEVSLDIDNSAKIVKALLSTGETRAARIIGDHGATLLPLGSAKAFYTPQPITSTLPPADALNWPMGDLNASGKSTADWDQDVLKQAADIPFSYRPNAHTAAFLAIHKGKIICERYGDSVDANMQLPSWSMGKTLTAILIGRLIEEGHLSLNAPAPIMEWQKPGDPRRDITIAHLLQMSSGLDFSATWSPDYKSTHGYPDHAYMYGGAIDVFQLALSRASAHPPGAFGAYKNGDTLALGAIIKRLVEAQGEDYLAWPQKNLFDLIGIRKLVLEADPYGNLVTSGFCYGTARDWARLGLLLLNDGVFDEKRLLPEGYVNFMRTPAPAWSGQYWMSPGPKGWGGSIYGGQVWLNRYPPEDRWPLPEDAYFMLGIGGQYCFIIPSMDLVIVRIGHVRGVIDNNLGRQPMADTLAMLMRAYRGGDHA